MKIRKANPKFKRFEKKKEEFKQEDVDECLFFILKMLKGDEKTLKEMEERLGGYNNVCFLVAQMVKYVMCYDMNLNPDCIYITNRLSSPSGGLMAWGEASSNMWDEGEFGSVIIYQSAYKDKNMVAFIANLIHEFRHVWQSVQKQRGHCVPSGVDMGKKPESDEGLFKQAINYAGNALEFDANMFSARMIERWLKDERVKVDLSKEQIEKRVSFARKKRAEAISNFVVGNIGKFSLGVLKSKKPYVFVQKLRSKVRSVSVSAKLAKEKKNREKIFNELEMKGTRNEADARGYLALLSDKSLTSANGIKLSEEEKYRIIDSMLVIFASEHNINPEMFNFIMTEAEEDDDFDFEFADARSIKKETEEFGVLAIPKTFLKSHDDLYFCTQMEIELEKVENDSAFQKALKDWKERHSLGAESVSE